MHLFFFSFQRTSLSYLSASLTFKDTTKVRYIFISCKYFPAFLPALCVKVCPSSLIIIGINHYPLYSSQNAAISSLCRCMIKVSESMCRNMSFTKACSSLSKKVESSNSFGNCKSRSWKSSSLSNLSSISQSQ